MQHSPTWNTASLPHLITAVKSRMRQVAFRHLAPQGLSPQQYQLVMAIAEHAAPCHGDLARITWMDKPTASRMLKTLLERGLVQSEPDPGHRRKLRFRLTAAGELLVQELQGFRKTMREGMELGLDAAERADLRELLAKVMDNLDRLGAGPGAAEGEA